MTAAFLSHRDQNPGLDLESEMGQYLVRKAGPDPEETTDQGPEREADPEEKTDPGPEREAGLDPETDLGTEDGTGPGSETMTEEDTMPGNCPKHPFTLILFFNE